MEANLPCDAGGVLRDEFFQGFLCDLGQFIGNPDLSQLFLDLGELDQREHNPFKSGKLPDLGIGILSHPIGERFYGRFDFAFREQ